MKPVISERSKYRLVGVLVVLAFAVIFLPVVMKKSNMRLEENINVSLKLPVKPALPQVAIPNQSTMLKKLKVAHVQIPTPSTVRQNSLIAKAEHLNPHQEIKQVSVLASIPRKLTLVAPKVAQVEQPSRIDAIPVKPVSVAKPRFSIQVATFSQKSNADNLIQQLHQKGYIATYNTLSRPQGQLYQVVVGQVNQRAQAVDLQKKLANNMQLNGLIVKVG